ncbi:hypothetical protein ACOME3_004780 [Neoechinorhynchus agilis]
MFCRRTHTSVLYRSTLVNCGYLIVSATAILSISIWVFMKPSSYSLRAISAITAVLSLFPLMASLAGLAALVAIYRLKADDLCQMLIRIVYTKVPFSMKPKVFGASMNLY